MLNRFKYTARHFWKYLLLIKGNLFPTFFRMTFVNYSVHSSDKVYSVVHLEFQTTFSNNKYTKTSTSIIPGSSQPTNKIPKLGRSRSLCNMNFKILWHLFYLPEYEDLEVSSNLKVNGICTFIMFIWGILGDTWCNELENTISSPCTLSTIIFLKQKIKF